MNSSVKCLVTGGAGFIGSHLCDALIDKGYFVYCVDNLITGKIRNISHLLKLSKFYFLNHDITKPFPKNLVSKLKNLVYLYHLASPASPPIYRRYSIETLLVNSVGTYNMLRLARKKKSVFLLSSTSEVYGDPLSHPQKETYFGNVNPVGKRACYDEGKRFAESITKEFNRKFGLNARIVRIFNTYGPRMSKNDGRVISNFITQALSDTPLTLYGDGTQTRSFCYISDMVDGLIKAAEKKGISGEVINLGNPDEQKIRDVGFRIIKLVKSKSKIVVLKDLPEDDPARRKPDITKARKILNWTPLVPFKDGLTKTIDYFSKL